MLNRIVLIGRLAKDVELRYTNSGTAVADFPLAVERDYKNNQGEKEVDFIKIVTWKNLAEICAEHIGKGRLVAVEGRLQIRKNKTKNRIYINPEVYAEKVQFLDYENDKNKRNNSQTNKNGRPQGHQNKQQQKPDQNGQSNIKNQNNNQSPDNYYEEDFDVPF